MTSVTLATIMQFAILGAAPETYAEAHRQTVETGRPMVVMVGAEWCPACKQMEATVIPQVRNRGLLARVAFALVDLDRERELGQRLIAGGPIPQLIVFNKAADGWHNRRLIGKQSVETVEEFISQDLPAVQAAGQVAAKPQAQKAATAKVVKANKPTQKVRPASSEAN